jgi:hypothetical protein
MLVLGLFVLSLAVALLVGIPRTRQAMLARKQLAWFVILGYLGVLVLHPYIFGLPGRIAEANFQRRIHPGITRAEVMLLARRYGGTTPFFGDLEPYVRGPSGELNVWFADWVSLCIVNGKNYSFYFSPNSELRSWKVEPLGNAC